MSTSNELSAPYLMELPMRTACLNAVLSLLVVSAVLLAPSVRAQEPIRVAALIDEIVDGEVRSSSSAEAQLLQEMMAAGMVVIDEAQSRKIRSVTDAGRLLEGGVSEVITSLDADIIVVGVCKVTLISKTVMGQPLVRYDADCETRATAVDTGEVIGVFNVRAEAMDLNQEQSAIKAGREAAGLISKKLVTAIADRSAGPERVEITVNGLTNVLATQTLKKAIQEMTGVKNLSVLQAARGVSKLAVELEGIDSATLAVGIQEIPELGLEVWGYSKRAVKADFSPAAALDVPLVVVPFQNVSDSRKDRYAAQALAEVFQIELADCQYLRYSGTPTKNAPGKDKPNLTKVAAELGVDSGSTIYLLGSYAREGDQYRVQAQAVVGVSGRALRSGQVSCPAEQFPGCAVALAQDFSANLLKDITDKPKLFSKNASTKTLALLKNHVPPVRPVEIAAVELQNLFPSRLTSYSNGGFGTVTIRNRGDKDVEAVTLSVSIKDYAPAPVDVPVGTVAAGAELQVPLKAVLDAKAMATLDDTRPGVLLLSVTYRLDEYRLEEKATRSLMIFDRNSMSWSEPTSLASFVDPKGLPLKALAGALTKAATTPEMRRHPLFLPAYTHEVLRSGGLSYQADAVNPYKAEALDFVNYPVETLASGAGDCDDLAVLYAAVLEATGVESALLLTPGHVLVAANTGVPAQFSATIWPDDARLLQHNGTVWIPIESTLTRMPFNEAWTKGAAELARYRDQDDAITVVSVRDAWQQYPPVTLAPGAVVDDRWVKATPEAGPEKLMADLEAARVARLKARTDELAAGLAKAPGNCDLLLEMARLQVAGRQFGEAATTLLKCKEAAAQGRVLNNQANIHALEGKLDDAQSSYKKALSGNPESVPLHANAGLVAFLRNDPDTALEHFVACLELGADDEVARLASLGVGGEARGAEGGGKSLPELNKIMAMAYKKVGKEAPPAPNKSETRASEAGSGGPERLLQHLRWL
jgi:tetratricopeptide (TPR) repeat protein/TolB-like protein